MADLSKHLLTWFRPQKKSKLARSLSELELYEFDLRGFLVLRKFLSVTVVEQMNEIIDRTEAANSRLKFPTLGLDPIFMDALSHPRAVTICEELLGKWFRFDHEYVLQEDPRRGLHYPHLNLHGGPGANQGTFQYQWVDGRPQCGLLTFGYVLEPVKEGDGGLVFLPGSHNQHLAISGGTLSQVMLKGNYEKSPWIFSPALAPGDLVIFTEAVIHGTLPWKPQDRRRRILYIRYCPGHMAWRNPKQNEKYLALARNNLERNLLRPPYVGEYNEDVTPIWTDRYREPTQSLPSHYTIDGRPKKKD